jgi:hypothetical protein
VTRAGKSLLALALPIWKQAHAQLDRLLDGADPGALRRDLRVLS